MSTGEIELRWYTKADATPGPTVACTHGGGMIAGSVDRYDEVVSWYVARSGVPFLSAELRLAPEATSPTSLAEDVFSWLTWLITHADDLGVDPSRVAVMGDSGGGGPAAGASASANASSKSPESCQPLTAGRSFSGRTVRSLATAVRFVPADLSDLDPLDELARQSGPVDILVNNAGAFPTSLTVEQSVDVYERIFATNVRGPYFLVAKLVPHMLAKGGGGIAIYAGQRPLPEPGEACPALARNSHPGGR